MDSNREDTSIALIANMPGETERIAECISPPLERDPSEWLDLVVGTAAEMGPTRPAEGATHLHYDADVNVIHLISHNPRLETVEFRMLPSSTDPAEVRNMIYSVDDLIGNLAHQETTL